MKKETVKKSTKTAAKQTADEHAAAMLARQTARQNAVATDSRLRELESEIAKLEGSGDTGAKSVQKLTRLLAEQRLTQARLAIESKRADKAEALLRLATYAANSAVESELRAQKTALEKSLVGKAKTLFGFSDFDAGRVVASAPVVQALETELRTKFQFSERAWIEMAADLKAGLIPSGDPRVPESLRAQHALDASTL